MLPAETAVLVQLETIRIILFVLFRVVVSLLALTARQGNFNSHIGTSCNNICGPEDRPYLPHASTDFSREKKAPRRGKVIIASRFLSVKGFFRKFRTERFFSSFIIKLFYQKNKKKTKNTFLSRQTMLQ